MTTNKASWNHDVEKGYFAVLPANANPVGTLPAGAYELGISMSGPYAQKIDLKDEELISFEDGPTQTILNEIRTFWSIEDRYKRLGVPYRRGILMHGEPGTGKSGIVRMVADAIIEGDGLVILVKNPSIFTNWLPELNRLEPNRKIVVILEDVDGLVEYDEHEFLQMLDGIGNDRPGMLFLATTNFLEEVPNRIYRPSRFDLLISVDAPSVAVRAEYVASLCKRFGVDAREDIIEASEGLSFAHLKEVLISCLLYEKDAHSVVQRMREHGADDSEDEEDD
jgi:AAA+ superfamily predicted ATPase